LSIILASQPISATLNTATEVCFNLRAVSLKKKAVFINKIIKMSDNNLNAFALASLQRQSQELAKEFQ